MGETYHTGDGGFAHVSQDAGRADIYVGDDGSSTHCHAYVDGTTGDQGIVHRGGCDQCRSDNNNSGDDSSGK